MQPRLLKHPARLAGSSLLRLQDDTRLVGRAREGHDPAFTAIVDRYGSQLERYCARLVGPGRAEDAVQQAFVNAHAAMRASDRELALKPWLYRIAHNAALNVLRASKDEEMALDEDRAGATQTADVVELREQLRETLASIQALPAAQRDALLLRAVEGRSHEEIAVALGVTAGGARQHLHRARLTLRAAASAITPYPFLSRILSAAASEGGHGADLVSGAGLGAGAGAMKAAAGVLAAGAIAGGAVTANHHRVGSNRSAAGSLGAGNSSAAPSASPTALETANGNAAATAPQQAGDRGLHGSSRRGHGRRQGATVDTGRRHGSSDAHRQGTKDDRGGSGHHHGSSGSGISGEGEVSHSGSGSSSSGHGSGDGSLEASHDGSGHGSDDLASATTTTDSSGSGSGSDDGTPSGSSGPGGGETTPTTTPTEPDHSGSGGGSDDPPTTTTHD